MESTGNEVSPSNWTSSCTLPPAQNRRERRTQAPDGSDRYARSANVVQDKHEKEIFLEGGTATGQNSADEARRGNRSILVNFARQRRVSTSNVVGGEKADPSDAVIVMQRSPMRESSSQQDEANTPCLEIWQSSTLRASETFARVPEPSTASAAEVSYQQQHQQQRNSRRESRPRRASFSCAAPTATSSICYGNFDDTRYWDYAFRSTLKGDMGHHCRECKRPFAELNEVIAVRRGGRIELRYHKACFSMIADPRSQPASSANVGKFVQTLKGTAAPEELYRKMRTRGHW